ncbi:MAG: alpha/beta family hydrolase [Rhodanobacteraceae bacterium]
MTHVAVDKPPTVFPETATSFHLPGPAGTLEVACDVPTGAHACAGTVIVCHPHPQHGGTMHNKVVTIIERALREVGLYTVRFNFRGVGESEGTYDEGRGEGDDLAAVAAWVRGAQPTPHALWLAGFSFGSYVALVNARRLAAAALITVAPPVGRWSFEGLDLPECPWLVVQGEDDEVIDAQAVFEWIDSLPNPPTLLRMPETGHFFHRRLMDLRGAIKNAVRSYLPPAISRS